MEKTTKKRKKSKRLKRRIGLIAVGGLSFVLTICLSVGATLAWFAGSTWASNDLYMGGPVYVEMAGRGENGYYTDTKVGDGAYDYNDDNLEDAAWRGGHGSLDIAASSRTTGTRAGQNDGSILLPGQKLLIYSQARVYSTLQTSTVADGANPSESSGANNSNTSNGKHTYYAGSGRVQTTTTSVLRAKFSINIEFDPSVGFNNFTDEIYSTGYPVQSIKYQGEYGTANYGTDAEIASDTTSKDFTTTDVVINNGGKEVPTNVTAKVHSSTHKAALTWESALGATEYSVTRTYILPGSKLSDGTAANDYIGKSVVTAENGRRDAVDNTALVAKADGVTVFDYDPANYDATKINAAGSVTPWVDGSDTKELWQVKLGLSKNIYKWKYVSKSEYEKDANAAYRLGAPFDGKFNTAGGPSAADKTNNGTGNGFYALYEHDASGNKLESDAFYKARTSNYLKSYKEHYNDDYGRKLVMEIGDSLATLEDALNSSFVDLVNQSSDNIWAGNITGFDAEDDGRIVYDAATGDPNKSAGIPASWLYVDPVIGNDTNASDSASSVGGWWYLVENDNTTGTNKATGNNTIVTEIDNIVAPSKVVAGTNETGTTGATTLENGVVKYNFSGTKDPATNTITTVPADARNSVIEGSLNFQRLEDQSDEEKAAGTGLFLASNDKRILNAKLYEITPTLRDVLVSTNADGTTTTKVVSYAFPFVNGNFELPGQALTNVFANAKISFQITFQALQAFFPFSTSIDSIPSGTAVTGTGKALNIGNAIPIYNEAFDYLSWL